MKNIRDLFVVIAIIAFVAYPFMSRSREPVKPKSSNPLAQKLVDQAWAALDYKMGILQLDQAIGYLERALALDPNNPEILVEIAGEYFQRGYQMPHSNDLEIQACNVYFEKGYQAAAKALSIKESPGAHYWLAANLGLLKQHESFMSQASILPEINSHLDWINSNHKNYRYGISARYWSGIITRAPGVIVRMMGEDPQQVYQDLEISIKAEPRYLENYIFKAEFIYYVGKKSEALDVLDQVLKMDPDAFPGERAHNRHTQKTARGYWKEWTGKEYPER